jgi:hypothetical protein
MESECSLPCSQEQATGPHREAARYVNWSRGDHDQQISALLPFAAHRALDILSQAAKDVLRLVLMDADFSGSNFSSCVLQ